jgi:NADH:ubiquinone oxidoreductase subunit C
MNLERPVEMVLRKRFSRVQVVESQSIDSEERLLLKRRHLVEALSFLRLDPDTQLDRLVDISVIHHDGTRKTCIYSHQVPGPYFEVFYALRSTKLKYRVRISVILQQELASLPTIVGVYPSANWLEREIWDLFGIFMEGHPDMRRLLLYESFDGHPLRKDYEKSLQS